VAFGFDEGPDFLDFAGFADEEGAADDAHERLAHELLFLPGAELLDRPVVGIAKQEEIELLLLLEGGLSFDGVRAHSKDGDAELIEVLFCVTKLGRFYRSTGRVCFGEEKKQDAPPREVFERDLLAFVGFEAKGWSFGTYFEH
jgi:hypothetical protein